MNSERAVFSQVAKSFLELSVVRDYFGIKGVEYKKAISEHQQTADMYKGG